MQNSKNCWKEIIYFKKIISKHNFIGIKKSCDISTNFAFPVAIVFGGEGKGLRKLTKDVCDELISVPMFGELESLNVSVASGVALFEVMNQKMSIKKKTD